MAGAYGLRPFSVSEAFQNYAQSKRMSDDQRLQKREEEGRASAAEALKQLMGEAGVPGSGPADPSQTDGQRAATPFGAMSRMASSNPDGAAKMFDMYQQQQAMQQEELAAKTKLAYDMFSELRDSPDAILEQLKDPLVIAQLGPKVTGMLAGQTPQSLKSMIERGDKLYQSAPVKLGPGDVLGRVGRPGAEKPFDEIFRVPNAPGADKAPQLKEGGNGNWWKFDPNTGEMKDTGIPAPKPNTGVTINMPGNVREGVDPNTGQPVFVGIDPKNPNAGFQTIAGATPPSNMMGAETRSKFMALAPNAYAGIKQLRGLFAGEGNPLAGTGTAAEIANQVPFVGDIAARAIGGQSWQDFDQAWNAIELGVHIPAGAAVSTSEAQRFLRANKPALGETKETTERKLNNVERFYQGLEAGFRGDWTGLQRLMVDSSSPASSGSGGAPQLDAEEQALVQQLRQMGKTAEEINAILSGQ